MINYPKPKIELIPEAHGIDVAIAKIQEHLSAIDWLEKIFGKATMQRSRQKTNPEGRETDVVYPEAYQNREPISLMINDNLKSYCFFHVSGPITFVDYQPLHDTDMRATAPVAIIFWMNLAKIAPARNWNFTEELRLDVLKVLKRRPEIKLKTSTTLLDQIFAPFTITDTFRQYLKPPYAAFRIDAEIAFDFFECKNE